MKSKARVESPILSTTLYTMSRDTRRVRVASFTGVPPRRTPSIERK